MELALVLPFLLALALFMVQGALVLSDQMALVAAAREAARAASVDPDPSAAQEAAGRVLPGAQARVRGARTPGRAIVVEVDYTSRTEVPVVGRLLPDRRLRQRAVMRAER